MLCVLDLFSGIGGFSLGLERTGGFETVAFCEIEPFCRKVLRKHWPDVPIYEDVRELTAERLGTDGIAVDVICGGFPCQDISHAGKGAGIDGERSGLWSEYARLIGELRPGHVIVENVAALLGRGLERVLGDLAALGYDAEWHCIPAAYVGAPHRRDRVWIIANADGWRQCERSKRNSNAAQSKQQASQWNDTGRFHSDVAYADQPRLEGWNGASVPQGAGECTARTSSASMADAQGSGWRAGRSRRSAGVGEGIRQQPLSDPDIFAPVGSAIAWQECDPWLAEPDVGRSPDGIPTWLDRCVGRGLSHAESCRRAEVLRGLWSDHVSQALRRAAGGLERISQAEVLFSFVREYESGTNEARLLVEGAEASEDLLRGLRERAVARSAPHRSRQSEQSAGEHPDALQSMSRLLARDSEAHWSGGGWEDAVPRVAAGIPSRVDRLKGLGNAVVPQIPELIGRAILKAEAA